MNDYSSSRNGGGVIPFIINIISRNIFDKIIRNSDLNGTITSYDINVWNTSSTSYFNHILLCQDNMRDTYLLYHTPSDAYNRWADKSYIEEYAPFFQINYR